MTSFSAKMGTNSCSINLLSSPKFVASLKSASSSSSAVKKGLPIEILLDHICPFLDRQTFNNVLLVSKQAYQCLTTSSSSADDGDVDRRPTPPWPLKLVSRDHMCRVRSLVFSNDGTELACGSSDGSIKVWQVWSGEQPSLRGHWPGEAVIALAYSNHNHNRHCGGEHQNLLASSSTDHTIRLWKKRSLQRRPKSPFCSSRQSQSNDGTDDDNNSSSSANSSAAAEKNNVTIQIRDAGHAYALMFSPDNTYLVSGHHPQGPQQQQHNPRGNANDNQDEQRQDDWGDANIDRRDQPEQEQERPQPTQQYLVPETIYLWSVATGRMLRRLENGGMPVGFLGPTTSCWTEQHRLLSTCAGESLKLWSLHGCKPSSSRNTVTPHSPSQCLQRLFLEGYTTVMPMPLIPDDVDDGDSSNHSATTTVADIMVASIDGGDSFTVWNTGGDRHHPKSYHTFHNSSPYEIKFTTNCTKVASVDNFTQVKVWNVQSGKLLKTFSQDTNNSAAACASGNSSSSNNNNKLLSASTTTSSSSSGAAAAAGRCHGGFPIHELAFCQDSTVAVVSRFHNEVHLFST